MDGYGLDHKAQAVLSLVQGVTMFETLVIESLVIYLVIVGVICYFMTRQVPSTGRKILIWIIFFICTFPGYFLWMIVWSALIGGLSEAPKPSVP
jgi:predicted small integral membrane protein